MKLKVLIQCIFILGIQHSSLSESNITTNENATITPDQTQNSSDVPSKTEISKLEPKSLCLINPCKNGGICQAKNNGVSCKCDENLYHGEFCQFSNGCSVFPCKNGGVCTAVENDFICECVPGYSGVTCLERNPCLADQIQCQNGGTCSRLSNKYWKCNCPKKYTGKYCETLKPCLSFNPCLNHGTCSQTLDGYNFQCTCRPGFYGNTCEFRDPCILDKYNCNRNHGTCERMTNFKSRCKCAENFSGQHCELISEEVNKCKAGFCQNNSTCLYDPNNNYKLKCICVAGQGHFGNQCEYFDPCLLEVSQCENNGICQRVGEGKATECNCNSELYHGTMCEFIKACYSSPCLYGSECENIKNEFYCHCPTGRRGRQCEMEIDDDPCKSRFQRYCLNGGTCKKGNSSSLTDYSCACTSGFSGKNCENEIKLNFRNPLKRRKMLQTYINSEFPCEVNFAKICMNGASCIMTSLSEYKCVCLEGWSGANCNEEIISLEKALMFLDSTNTQKEDIDITQNQKRSSGLRNPLNQPANLGRKIEPQNSTKQIVSPAALSPNITHSLSRSASNSGSGGTDTCTNNPCLHKGTCVLDKKGYHCDCPVEFLGRHCEKRDPCKLGGDADCLNGGTCVRINDVEHVCQCMLPYGGIRCEDENKCKIEPKECIDYPSEEPKCFPCEPDELCVKFENGTYNCGNKTDTLRLRKAGNGSMTLECVRNCNSDIILDNKIVLKCTCFKCDVLWNEWEIRINGLRESSNNDIWKITSVVNATPDSIAFIAIDPKKVYNLPTASKNMDVSCSKYGYEEPNATMIIPLKEHPSIDCDFYIKVGPENFAFLSKFILQMNCSAHGYTTNLPQTLAIYVKPHGKLSRIGQDTGYYLIHHLTTNDTNYFVSKNEDIELVLPGGDPTENYELPIRILIIDRFGRINLVKRLNRTVLNIPNALVEVQKWSKSPTFPLKKFIELDFQQILALMHYLSLSEHTEISLEEEIKVKSLVLQDIQSIIKASEIKNIFQLEQMIGVFYAIVHQNPDTLEDTSFQPATETISEYGKALLGYLRGGSKNGTLEKKNDIYADKYMFGIIYTSIASIETLAKRVETVIFAELDVNKRKPTLPTTSKEVSVKILSSLEPFVDALGSLVTAGENPLVVHEQGFIGVFVYIIHKSSFEKPFRIPNSQHSLFLKNYLQLTPSKVAKVAKNNTHDLVQVSIVISNFNPFLNQDLHNFSITPLILFEHKDDYDLRKLKLNRINTSLSHEFHMGYLNHEDSVNRIPTGDLSLKISLNPFADKDYTRHLISALLPKQTVDLYLVLTIDVIGLANMGLNIVVKRESRPTCEDWINQTTHGKSKIVKFAERTHGAVHMFETSTSTGISELLYPTMKVEELVDYLALLWFNSSTDIPEEIKIKDDYFGVSVNGHIAVSTIHCVSKENLTDDWKSDCFVRKFNCPFQFKSGSIIFVSTTLKVIKTNEIEKGLICQCNHTSTIGSSLIPVIVTDQTVTRIDLFNNMNENVLIPYIVISCLIAYLVLLGVAAWIDALNRRRPRFILMNDFKRIKCDTYYLLTFETGNDWFAGTSAKVYCQIFGENGKTQIMILNDIFMHCMRQNDESNFIFSLPKPLGNILKLHLWHDNAGPKPAWFCRKVVIRDIKTEDTWFFFVRKWISISHGINSLAVELKVATEEEVADDFKNKFALRDFWHQIREHHIWISPVTTKPRSTHTRAERLTCAMALLCTYMFLITFLYEIPDHLKRGGVIYFKTVTADTYYPIWSIGTKASLLGLLVGWLVVHFFRYPIHKENTGFVRRQMVPTLIISDYYKDKSVDILPEEVKSSESLGFRSSLGRTGGQPFRVPSTDLSQTEGWVQEIKVEPGQIIGNICEDKPYGSPFIHKYHRRYGNNFKHHNQPTCKRPLEITVQGPLCISQRRPFKTSCSSHRSHNPCEPSLTSVRRTICKCRKRVHHTKDLNSVLKLLQLTQMLSDPSSGKPKIVYPDIKNHDAESQCFGDSRVSFKSTQSQRTSSKHVSFGKSIDNLEGKQEELYINNNIENEISSKDDATSTFLKFVDEEKDEPCTAEEDIPYTELGLVEYQYEHHQCLPRIFIWPAWGLSIMIIIICSIVNIYYGYFASWEISLGWCYSLIWALVESILILQPFKACLAYMLLLWRNKEHRTTEEETRVKTRFKLIWLVGKIGPGIQIWPMPYCFHPLSLKGKLGIAPDDIIFPLNRGKWRRKSRDGVIEPDSDSDVENLTKDEPKLDDEKLNDVKETNTETTLKTVKKTSRGVRLRQSIVNVSKALRKRLSHIGEEDLN